MVRHKRPKKKPLSSTADPAAVSHKVTQSTISQFHTLLKQKSILKRQIAATDEKNEKTYKELLGRLVEVENKLEASGGLKAYQEASRLGQAEDRGGDSSKILVGWLRAGAFAGKGKERESHEKIRQVKSQADLGGTDKVDSSSLERYITIITLAVALGSTTTQLT